MYNDEELEFGDLKHCHKVQNVEEENMNTLVAEPPLTLKGVRAMHMVNDVCTLVDNEFVAIVWRIKNSDIPVIVFERLISCIPILHPVHQQVVLVCLQMGDDGSASSIHIRRAQQCQSEVCHSLLLKSCNYDIACFGSLVVAFEPKQPFVVWNWQTGAVHTIGSSIIYPHRVAFFDPTTISVSDITGYTELVSVVPGESVHRFQQTAISNNIYAYGQKIFKNNEHVCTLSFSPRHIWTAPGYDVFLAANGNYLEHFDIVTGSVIHHAPLFTTQPLHVGCSKYIFYVLVGNKLWVPGTSINYPIPVEIKY